MQLRSPFSALAAILFIAVTGACGDSTGPNEAFRCTVSNSPAVAVAGDTVVAESGLRYIETSAGSGAQVQSGSTARVCYVGFLPDGTVFDSGQFRVAVGQGQVIQGFDEGLIGIREGGTRRLIIPPELGYGSEPVLDRGTGKVVIPASSTLIFDVGIAAVQNP